MNNTQDIDKAYVSPYDEFLYKFDATHTPSLSQSKEIKKYQRIFALRDIKDQLPQSKQIWTEF